MVQLRQPDLRQKQCLESPDMPTSFTQPPSRPNIEGLEVSKYRNFPSPTRILTNACQFTYDISATHGTPKYLLTLAGWPYFSQSKSGCLLPMIRPISMVTKCACPCPPPPARLCPFRRDEERPAAKTS